MPRTGQQRAAPTAPTPTWTMAQSATLILSCCCLALAGAPAAAWAASADLRLDWYAGPYFQGDSPPTEIALETAFVVVVTNASATDAAVGVAVTAATPEHAQVSGVSNCTPAVYPGQQGPRAWFPCAVSASLAPGASTLPVVITVAYTMPTTCPTADHFGPVTISAASSTPDPDPSNNSLSAAPLITLPLSDLAVEVTGPDAISPGGGTYQFTYRVTNHGPCESVEAFLAVDDTIPTAFRWLSATGPCGGDDPLYGEAITGDWQVGRFDYQYCDVPPLAVGESIGGTKTYAMDPLASDISMATEGTGLQIVGWRELGGPGDYTDPVAGNNRSGIRYSVTVPSGCGSGAGGGGTPLGLLAVVAAALLRRGGGRGR
jgi:hypothetical protein